MRKKIVIATAASLLVGGALVIGTAAWAQPRGGAMGPRMFQNLCTEGPARLAGMLATAEVRLNLRPEQRPGWEQLAAAVRGAAQPLLQGACAEAARPAPESGDVAARLQVHERVMAAGLEAVRAVRPAVERFQATLSTEQRDTLARLMQPRHGGRFGGHHDMGRGERGPDRGERGPGGPMGRP